MEIFGHALVAGEEVRSGILGEDRALGWKAVPAHCPEHIRLHIIETREARLEGREPLAFLPTITADPWLANAAKRLGTSL